ncbi:MAG: branched-chain amino acid ABC transporter permease [Aggregatilineales bacterium]
MKSPLLSYLARLQTPLILIGLLVIVQFVILVTGSTINERIITVMFINIILVVALQMFMGNSGVVSFAHIGFMGIGAYTSIIFTLSERMKGVTLPNLYPFLESAQLPFLPALVVGGLVAAVIAAVFGFPLMRLSGAAAVIATFALLVIIHVVLLNWNQITNGPRTVFGIDRLTTSWLALGWAVAVVALGYAYKESRLGLMLRASREDDKAASSLGIDIVRMRWIAFIISAFLAGVAGGLYAHFITSFGAGAFYIGQTFLIIAMLVIGGQGSVSGAVIGVLVVTLLSEGLRGLENAVNIARIFPDGIAGATEVLVSIAMVLMLIARPGGITGGAEIKLPALRSRRAEAAVNAPISEGERTHDAPKHP